MNTKALRQKVLDLAIHGKLVLQNPNDESAEVLLKKIREEKAEKIKKGELKADKKDSFFFVGSDKRHYEQFADGTVKDIEDEIPFDVPEGWAWIRQKNLGIAINGKAFKPSDWTKKGLPIVRIQNLNDKTAPYNYFDKDIDESFLLHGGELLFAWSGTPGTSFGAHIWDKGDAVLNQHIFKILFDEKTINKTFYKYCLNNQVEKLIEVAHGSAGLAHITKNMFDEVLIPLPPYNEQIRIVSEFEKTISLINCINDNKIELNNTIKQVKSKILDLAIHGKLVPQDPNDEPAEELLKRIATSDNRPYKKFAEEVLFEIPESWSWCYLHTISALFNGDRGENYPSKKDYVEYGIPFINAGCLDNGTINYDVANYITEEKYNSLRAGKIQKGDILYCLRGSLGKTGFVITDNKGAISSSLCIFRLSEAIIPQFFLYVLNSNAIKVQQQMVDNGTAQPNLSAKDVSNFAIPIPPISEQSRIVSKIEELFSFLDTISSNLE